MDLPSSLVCQSSRRGIFKHIFGTGAGRKVGEALEDITCCLAVALMYYTVFFRDPLGPDLAHVWCFWGWRGCWLGVLVGVVCTNRGCFSLLG